MHKRDIAVRTIIRIASAMLALWLTLTAAPVARAEVIERVVAVVNDEAIFLSELRRRAVPFLDQVLQASTDVERMARLEQLYRELLDLLIDEELVSQAARRLSVRVTTEDVNRAIANVQRQSNLEDAEFWQAVRAQGFTEAQYRTDVRRQLLRLKVLNQRVRGRVNLTEDEVRRRYEQQAGRARRALRFRAAHILLRLPSDATATQVAAVRQQAEALKAQLDANNFSAAIEEHEGGELGWLTQGDLPEELENALSAMQPGQVGGPVRSPNGFHILLLHERERGNSELPSYAQAREQIYRELLDAAMQRQQALFLNELRHQAVISRRL